MENPLFLYQVIATFVAGGLLVGGQSILVEKAPKSISGVLAGLPTSMVIGFFFLGLAQGSGDFGENLQNMPVAVTGALTFLCVFCLTAPFFSRSLFGCVLTFLIAYASWIIFPLSAAYWGPLSWFVSLGTFFIVALLLQVILWKKSGRSSSERANLPFSWKLLFLRCFFSGFIMASALVVFKLVSPFWGLVLGASFPISWSIQVGIFYWRQPLKELAHMFLFAPISSVLFILYYVSVAWLFPLLGVWGGTAGCVIISWIGAFLIYILTRKLSHE